MSQADVAFRLREHGHKATERSIRRWETGVNAPHANVVPALAEALGVSIDALYEQTETGDEDEDEAAVLRRIAHQLIDRNQSDLAETLLHEVRLMASRREERSASATPTTNGTRRSTYPGSAAGASQEKNR